MKVALFVHCFFPEHFYGTETYTLEVARNLRRLGHDATVVSAVFPGEPPRAALVTRYEHEGVPVVCVDKNHLPHRSIRDTYYQPEMREVLSGILAELAPDVVHVTHLINHTAALLDVVAERGIPCVATFTDFFGFCYNNKLEAADGSACFGPNALRTNCLDCHLRALRDQGAVEQADALSLPAPWRRWSGAWLKARRILSRETEGPMAQTVLDISVRPDLLRDRYRHYAAGIAPTEFLAGAYRRNRIPVPLHRISFGVDIDRGPKPARPAGTPLTFGFIGQIAPHKGTDLLVDAFARLPEGAARLLVHGPANQDPAFYRLCEEKAAGRAVEFRGTFPAGEMAAKLAEIDVLVIPSRWYENSPLVLLYALATHTPVVVTDVEGLTEFVKDGESGFAFPKGDVGALAAALRRFVDDPSLLPAMRETTRYEQDTASMTEAVVAVYEHARQARCAA